MKRYGFLENVGLDYLTFNRAAGTLSGGEAQRIRLSNSNRIKTYQEFYIF